MIQLSKLTVKEGKKEPSNLKVARKLGTEIVTGTRPPGSVLPGEIELAQDLGVSRSVVREALRMLGAKGLLLSKPKAGTRVRNRQDWNLLDPIILEWMFDSVPPADFVRSLFELRMIVEPAAAEAAARKRTARQLSVMGHALEVMATKKLDSTEGQEADQLFHATILEATDNILLINLSASIGAAVRWTTFFKSRTQKKVRDPIQEHRDLFQAIADSDAEAARAATATLIGMAETDTEHALSVTANEQIRTSVEH